MTRNRESQEEDWTTEGRAEWDTAMEALENEVKLVCPKSGWQTIVFPNASDLNWGCFLTQVLPEDFGSDFAVAEMRQELGTQLL